MLTILRLIKRFAVCVAVVSIPTISSAQALLGDSRSLGDLRAEQAQLFQQLISEPDNLDLMFNYAKLSIRLEDYEAAISTLERMLIYRQDLSRVRLELAVSYFNLGSYSASELYFDQVLADTSTPDNVRLRIGRYKEAIASRTQTSAFTALANVGITYATNATQGPDSDQVLLAGNVANLVAGQAEDDTGMRVVLNIGHSYDLQQEDDDVWRTDLNLFALKYFDTSDGDITLGRIRTGPRLSVDDQQFGPKIRPYVEAQYLTSESRGLFAAFGAGAEFSDTISPTMSVFGDAGIRYRNYFRSEFTDDDNISYYGAAGIAIIPERDVVVRATALAEMDQADGDENSNIELGLRVSAEYQYDAGLSWVDRKWSTSAFTEVRGRFFQEADPLVDPNTKRQDIDIRSGIRQVFAIQQGFGIQLDVDALMRESNILNFDLDNISGTISLQYRM